MHIRDRFYRVYYKCWYETLNSHCSEDFSRVYVEYFVHKNARYLAHMDCTISKKKLRRFTRTYVKYFFLLLITLHDIGYSDCACHARDFCHNSQSYRCSGMDYCSHSVPFTCSHSHSHSPKYLFSFPFPPDPDI